MHVLARISRFTGSPVMSLSKQLWRSLTTRNKITSSDLLKRNENNVQLSSVFVRNHSKTNSEMDEELNKPVRYTTSQAHDWKASHSRLGSKAEFGPWYEPHLVSASLFVFMVYFFILREENDIDLMLYKPLTETLKDE